MDNRYFTKSIVEWYATNKRDLPWRHTQDPYLIWLSEVILQQTRVNQGLPYYYKFIQKLPTLHSFANASEDEILSTWQGLGYYSRARNMHKCAKVIVANYNGVFPASHQLLLELPGIGPYTAAAIASFAFKIPVPVVDGNVFRVLARVFGLSTPINSPAAKTVFNPLASQLLDENHPDSYNQAIMEFGALQCIPQNPDCSVCPLSASCFARIHDCQKDLPVKNPASKSKVIFMNYFVIQFQDKIWFKKRNQKGIWFGLYDFPVIESESALDDSDALMQFQEKYPLKWLNHQVFSSYKHILSHRILHCTFQLLLVDEVPVVFPEGEWISVSNLEELPKPVLISKFLVDAGFLLK